MPRLPLKKTEKLSIKEAYGKKLGELKALLHFKKTKAGMELSFREHLGKIIDRLDVLEAIAILGLTYLIKQVLIENFEDKIAEIATGKTLIPALIRKYTPLETLETALKATADIPQIELMEWLLSFCIAYIIIKHGGALFTMLGEGAKSLTGIVGLFFA